MQRHVELAVCAAGALLQPSRSLSDPDLCTYQGWSVPVLGQHLDQLHRAGDVGCALGAKRRGASRCCAVAIVSAAVVVLLLLLFLPVLLLLLFLLLRLLLRLRLQLLLLLLLLLLLSRRCLLCRCFCCCCCCSCPGALCGFMPGRHQRQRHPGGASPPERLGLCRCGAVDHHERQGWDGGAAHPACPVGGQRQAPQ